MGTTTTTTTTTTTKATTQKPGSGKCVNKMATKQCQTLKSKGYCRRGQFMHKCLATCGFCKNGPDTCLDRNKNCARYAKYCGPLVKTDYAMKVKAICRKTCGLCKDAGNTAAA